MAAVIVWFGLAPDQLDHASVADAIESTDDANNSSASGAPQQAVVNGWTAIDFLHLLSTQLDEATATESRDQRPAAMLGLVVLGMCLTLVTSAPTRERVDT